MIKVIDSSPPTPYWMLNEAGIYDVQSSSDNANEKLVKELKDVKD